MAFTCALTKSQILDLYAVVYKKFTNGGKLNDILSNLFNTLKENSDAQTAAKFIQIVPKFASVISSKNTPENIKVSREDVLLAFDLNLVYTSDKGIENILNQFDPVITPQDLKDKSIALSDEEELLNSTEELVEMLNYPVFDVVNPFKGSLLEKDKESLASEDFTHETDPERIKLFKIFEKLNALKQENSDTIVFNGKQLFLKPINVRYAQGLIKNLDNTTKQEITRAFTLEKQGKKDKNFTSTENMFMIVVSDVSGNIINFNINSKGELFEDSENGMSVYQYLRDVRTEGSKKTITNFHGKNVMIDSFFLAKKLEVSDKEAQNILQSLAVAQENLLTHIKNEPNTLLEFTGVYAGLTYDMTVPTGLTVSNADKLLNINLKELLENKGSILTSNYNQIRSGKLIISDNSNDSNKVIVFDRPDIAHKADDISNRFAKMLVSSIDLNFKLTALQSIFNNGVNVKYNNIKVEYNRNSPNYGKIFIKSSGRSIDIKNLNSSDLGMVESFLKEGITTPAVKSKYKHNFYIPFISSYLNQSEVFVYPDDNGVLKPQSYSDFILSLNPNIQVASYIGRSFIHGGLRYNPQPFGINNLKEELENNIKTENAPQVISNIRKTKNEIVDELKKSKDLNNLFPNVATIAKEKTVYVQTSQRSLRPYGQAKITVSVNGKTFETLMNFDPVFIPDQTTFYEMLENYSNKELEVKLNNITTEDGRYIPDVIELYYNGLFIGQVKETDIKVESFVEYSKPDAKEEIQEKIIDVKTPGENTSKIDEAINDKLDLLRKNKLTQSGVTQEQIDKAEEWWSKNPLSKFISLNKMYDIVNSNAYAKFTVSADTLYSAKIDLFNGSTSVDVYHEAWHAFSQLFLTKLEKEKLYTEIQKDPKYKDFSFFDIEEELAERFRNYARTEKVNKSTPVANSLFRKILNFLKALFGKKAIVTSDILELSNVKELFNNLYFASNNPELLNNYNPSINNVYFKELNSSKGIMSVKYPEVQALSLQDSTKLNSIMDNVMSEAIDKIYDAKVAKAKQLGQSTEGFKAGSLELITNPLKRGVLYEIIKADLEEKLSKLKQSLNYTSENSLFSIASLASLEKNALGIIKSNDPNVKNIYILHASQVDNYNKLVLSTKSGRRNKGLLYKKSEILTDFYMHETIKNYNDKNQRKGNVEIIVVNDIDTANRQYKELLKSDEYKSSELILNSTEVPKIENKETVINDQIRLLETAINNYGLIKNEDGTYSLEGLVKYHYENSDFKLADIKSTIIDNIEEDAVENSITGNIEKMDNQEVGRESILDMADKKIVYLIKSLHKVNKKTGKPVLDEFGFKQKVNFKNVWNTLVNLIGGLEDPSEVIKILQENSSSYPELAQLVNYKLPNPDEPSTDLEFDITTNFWQSLRNYRTRYKQLNVSASKNEAKVSDASIEIKSVIKNWKSQFRSDITNPFVEKNEKGALVLNTGKVLAEFRDKLDTGENQLRFLNALGIYIDDVIDIKKELENINTRNLYGVSYIYKALETIHNELPNLYKNEKEKILGMLQTPVSLFLEDLGIESLDSQNVLQNYQIDNLVKLNAKFGEQTSNFGVLTADKNLVFEHINNHSIAMIVKGLNKMNSLSDAWNVANTKFQYLSYLDPSINTFTSRSSILKSMFNFNTPNYAKYPKNNLNLIQVSGTQMIDTESGTNTTNLDEKGKFLQELHTMLKGGFQEFMRHASKASSFGAYVDNFKPSTVYGTLRGKLKGADKRLYVPLDLVASKYKTEVDNQELDNYQNYLMHEFFIPFIAHETERITKVKQDIEKYKKIQGYSREIKYIDPYTGKEITGIAGEFYTAFDTVLSRNTKNQILSKVFNNETKTYITLEQAISENPGLYELIKKDVVDYFNHQTQENSKIFYSKPFLSEDFDNKLKAIGVDNKDNVNLTAIEAFTLNSWIHNFETANLMYGDIVQYNHAKEEMHKRNTGSTSGGPGFRTDINAQKFINSKFNIPSKTWAGKLGIPNFTYNGTYNTAILQDVKRDSIYADEIEIALRKDYTERLKNSGLPQEEINKYVEERVSKEIAKYKDDNSSMEEGDGAGYITFDAYRVLKKLEGKWEDAQELLFQKIINKQEITAEDVVKFFPPYKVQHFGHLANSREIGSPINAMHKFALYPMIPAVYGITEETRSDMEKLHIQMMQQNIQYAVFQTGSKVGNVTSNGKADVIYDDSNQKVLKEDIKFIPNTIYLEYLKSATEVNNKFKKEVIFSTQLRKLILEGLYQEGKLIKPKYASIAKNYEIAVNAYTAILRKELINEIKFKELPDGSYTGDYSNLMDIVKREFERKELPANISKFFDTTMDYSLLPNAEDVEKIIIAIVEKRLVKQKVKGEPLVQVPSSFTNGLWDKFEGPKNIEETEEYTKKYLGSNTLPFYHVRNGKTQAMKVAIALQGDFKYLLNLEYKGEPIKTIDRLNQAIKDDEWLDTNNNRKAITMVGVRIPVQGLNSMENMEVYHFLNPSAGNIIIPPTEIVAKSGGDFDVDKLTIVMPNITKEGEYLDINKEFDLNQLLNEIDTLPEKEKNKAIKNYKKALNNNLIATISDILSLEENYATLVRPNDTYLLKPLADNLESKVLSYDRFVDRNGKYYLNKEKKLLSPTKVFEVGYNLHKHSVNMIGKKGLGIVALENTLNTVFTSLGAKMPKYYTEENDPLQVEHKVNIKLPHNTTSTGEVSLSHRLSVDNKDLIADILSQMMNGLVDVEKDAWIFFIQGNLEVIPVLTYLIKAGVPREHAIKFVSSPIIREYAELQRSYKSSYEDLFITPEDVGGVKYRAQQSILTRIPSVKNIQQELIEKRFKDVLDFLEKNYPDYKFYDSKSKTTYSVKQVKSNSNLFNKFKTSNIKIDDIEIHKNYKNIFSDALYPYYTSDEFSLEELNEVIDNEEYNLDHLMHFISLEKQLSGLSDLKRLSNPDTSTSKNYQQVVFREYSWKEASQNTKIDPELAKSIEEESILSSFKDKSLVKSLIEPIFELTTSKEIEEFIINTIKNRKSEIIDRYGKGDNAISYFINDFNKSLKGYIFQTYMSNIVDNEGNSINVPDFYDGKEVHIITENIPNGIIIEDNKYYINTEILHQQFIEKAYLTKSKSTLEFSNVEKFNEDYFGNDESAYYNYLFSREKLRNLYSIEQVKNNPLFIKLLNYRKDEKKAYNSFINQRALINTFNAKFILSNTGFSYADIILDIIKENPTLKSKYPILEQIAEAPFKEKILTLNDRDLLQGDLATIYNQNLRELASENVMKVTDPHVNKHISEMFKLFPLIMLYQHGTGKSKYGIINALDIDDYINIMIKAKAIFKNKLNSELFTEIVNENFTNRSSYKDLAKFNRIVQDSVNKKTSVPAEVEAKLTLLDLGYTQEEVDSMTSEQVLKELNRLQSFERIESLQEPVDNFEKEVVEEYDEINQQVNTETTNEVQEVKPESTQLSLFEKVTQNVQVISTDYGVIQAETNPSKEFDQKLVNLISNNIKNNAYVENGSSTANLMFSYGWQWKGNNTKNPTGTKLKVEPARVDYNANGNTTPVKSKYFYDSKYNDGTPIPNISELDFLKRHIEKVLGIDMSNYDVALNNIYTESTDLYRHTDIDESNTAKGYPVIVYVLGNQHKVRIDDNGGKRGMGQMVNPKTLTLKNGYIYTFGVDGKGRFEAVHDVIKSSKDDYSFPPITLPDGRIITNYTITFTFRRAADLEQGMPNIPKKLENLPNRFEDNSLEYSIITDLYEKLSKEDKEKMGNLAELLKEYENVKDHIDELTFFTNKKDTLGC